MRSIGISFGAIGGLSDEEYVRQIAALGFTATFTGAAESDARQAEYGNLFAKYGVTYENLHAPFGHINDIWLDCEGGEVMVRELTECIDRCAAGGAPIAVVHLSSGMTPPSITDLGRSRWERVVNYAAQRGIRIAFENQRMLANLAWAMEAFPDQGFCWDCGHESCFTPGREYMPLFGKRLICTHIHDNSGIFDEDQHLIPFDGALDFPRIARQLQEVQWQGTLMLELKVYRDISPKEYLRRAATAANRLAQMMEV